MLILIGALQAVQSSPNDALIGKRLPTTKKILGEPRGRIQTPGVITLLYPRGEIELVEGQVVEANLLSQEAWEEKQRRKKRWREWHRQKKKKIKAERLAKALELKEKKMNDPVFLAKPLNERITFWDRFLAANPKIDVSDHLDDLKRKQRQKEAERQKRWREKQQRAQEEARKKYLKKQAEAQAKQKYGLKSRLFHRPLRAFYYTPAFRHRTHYRHSPKIIIHSAK